MITTLHEVFDGLSCSCRQWAETCSYQCYRCKIKEGLRSGIVETINTCASKTLPHSTKRRLFTFILGLCTNSNSPSFESNVPACNASQPARFRRIFADAVTYNAMNAAMQTMPSSLGSQRL